MAMDIKNKKILFADLDGTLIRTVSGKTFPEDVTDFRIRKEVLDAIQRMPNLLCIAIVTNQGGIPQYVKEHEFQGKLGAIRVFTQLYMQKPVAAVYCDSMDKTNPNRKPNTGMLYTALEYLSPAYQFNKADMLMIGDASGKEGQFSDSDKKTAENFGIDYLDVDDFVEL